jgi:hypothetical protein
MLDTFQENEGFRVNSSWSYKALLVADYLQVRYDHDSIAKVLINRTTTYPLFLETNWISQDQDYPYRNQPC